MSEAPTSCAAIIGPEVTAAAIDRDGWFNTGDLGRFDGDILFISRPHQGADHPLRLQRLSGRGRAVLNEHPAVVQSAVIGRAVTANEEVVAFVQPLPGSTVKPTDLMAHAARQLAPYKRP
jgi:acyl-CoA synthetase (AMP-forming)/AMP-acid ligase II